MAFPAKEVATMARRLRFVFPVILGFWLATWAPAQTPKPKKAPEQAGSAMHVNIGESVIALYGPWKFQVGDSPLDPVTHAPLWADPRFDDSKWETVDLTPKAGSLDPVSGLSGYVPGWTQKGHPGYWGYAWYRIHAHIATRPGVRLALAGPGDVDDVYQAFDGGKLVGSFGDFSSSRPVVYFTQPMMFELPPSAADSAGESTRVLAFRLWMEPNTLLAGDDVGGFHTAPLLGEVDAVAARHQMRWLELVRSYALSPVQALMFGLLGLVACSLVLFDRSDRVYLWIGALLLTASAQFALLAIGSWTQWISALIPTVVQDVLFIPLIFTGWVMVWRVWFRLRHPAWVPQALAALVLLLMLSNALGDNVFFTFVPQPVSHAFLWVSLAVRVMLVALMLGNVIEGIRKEGLEGWLVLPAVVLAGISGFAPELRRMHIPTAWFLFGATFSLFQLANLLLVVVLSVLLLRRLVVSLRNQRLLALDVKQAQEVQQVILPQARTTLPGLVIESEYRPALVVGGDFFQIIPHATDGSLLIVAGDVTGKGLKAGMLVALLVGAIRSTAELNSDPEFVLQALNRRLLGRGEAHATCLALRIGLDGAVTLANAGHMPPFLNGQPLTVDGALPLGMLPKTDCSVKRFKLLEGDRLVLMSDGVVEATNAEGHLFGFERVHALLRTATTAAEVALIAQTFGQEDDISVISVTRTAVMEAVPA